MSRQAVVSWGDLSWPQEAGTICQRIYILLERISDANDYNIAQEQIIGLANELMSKTKTYDILFMYLYESLMSLNYAKALQVGKLLLQHEAVLHAIATEDFAPRATLN